MLVPDNLKQTLLYGVKSGILLKGISVTAEESVLSNTQGCADDSLVMDDAPKRSVNTGRWKRWR